MLSFSVLFAKKNPETVCSREVIYHQNEHHAFLEKAYYTKNKNRLCSKTCGIDKMKKSNETKVEKIEWLKQDDLLRSEFVQ